MQDLHGDGALQDGVDGPPRHARAAAPELLLGV
jgi:hypothetical protein